MIAAATMVGVAGAVLVTLDVWTLLAQRLVSGSDDGMTLLALLGCGWLLWRRRAALVPGPAGAGAALLLILAPLAIQAGNALHLRFVSEAGALLLAPAVLALALGRQALWALAPAWIALLFALPVPGIVVEQVALPLQSAEARGVELLALLLGFDVLRDGVVVILEGTPVRIDEACSGFTLLWPVLLACWVAVASVALPAGRGGLGARALLLGLAMPVALLANLLRLACSVLAYAYGGAEIGAFVHDALGWVLVVAVGAAPFLMLGDATTGVPQDRGAPRMASARRGTFAVVPVALLLAAFPFVGGAVPTAAQDDLDLRLRTLPWRLEGLVGARRALPAREQELLGADAVVHRAYVDLATGEELLLVAAWHRDALRAQGHGALKCYRARGWRLDSAAELADGGAGERTFRFRFRRAGEDITVFEATLNPRAADMPEARVSAAGQLRVLLVFDGSRDDAAAAALVGRFVAALDRVAAGGHA